MPVDCSRAFETGDSKIHVSEPSGFKCKNKLLFLWQNFTHLIFLGTWQLKQSAMILYCQ